MYLLDTEIHQHGFKCPSEKRTRENRRSQQQKKQCHRTRLISQPAISQRTTRDANEDESVALRQEEIDLMLDDKGGVGGIYSGTDLDFGHEQNAGLGVSKFGRDRLKMKRVEVSDVFTWSLDEAISVREAHKYMAWKKFLCSYTDGLNVLPHRMPKSETVSSVLIRSGVGIVENSDIINFKIELRTFGKSKNAAARSINDFLGAHRILHNIKRDYASVSDAVGVLRDSQGTAEAAHEEVVAALDATGSNIRPGGIKPFKVTMMLGQNVKNYRRFMVERKEWERKKENDEDAGPKPQPQLDLSITRPNSGAAYVIDKDRVALRICPRNPHEYKETRREVYLFRAALDLALHPEDGDGNQKWITKRQLADGMSKAHAEHWQDHERIYATSLLRYLAGLNAKVVMLEGRKVKDLHLGGSAFRANASRTSNPTEARLLALKGNRTIYEPVKVTKYGATPLSQSEPALKRERDTWAKRGAVVVQPSELTSCFFPVGDFTNDYDAFRDQVSCVIKVAREQRLSQQFVQLVVVIPKGYRRHKAHLEAELQSSGLELNPGPDALVELLMGVVPTLAIRAMLEGLPRMPLMCRLALSMVSFILDGWLLWWWVTMVFSMLWCFLSYILLAAFALVIAAGLLAAWASDPMLLLGRPDDAHATRYGLYHVYAERNQVAHLCTVLLEKVKSALWSIWGVLLVIGGVERNPGPPKRDRAQPQPKRGPRGPRASKAEHAAEPAAILAAQMENEVGAADAADERKREAEEAALVAEREERAREDGFRDGRIEEVMGARAFDVKDTTVLPECHTEFSHGTFVGPMALFKLLHAFFAWLGNLLAGYPMAYVVVSWVLSFLLRPYLEVMDSLLGKNQFVRVKFVTTLSDVARQDGRDYRPSALTNDKRKLDRTECYTEVKYALFDCRPSWMVRTLMNAEFLETHPDGSLWHSVPSARYICDATAALDVVGAGELVNHAVILQHARNPALNQNKARVDEVATAEWALLHNAQVASQVGTSDFHYIPPPLRRGLN